MEVVYGIKGYLSSDNEFGDIPSWQGNVIMDYDNWVWGTASIIYDNEIKEVLVFGNVILNKIIDIIMVGPDIVIGCTFIKNGYCYEGIPVIGDFKNISASPKGNGMVVLEEKKQQENAYIDYIKKKVYNMVDIDDYRMYLDFYNNIYDNRDKYRNELNRVYSLTKGNYRSLAKTIFKKGT